MFDPENPEKMERLRTSIIKSRQMLEPFRKNRKMALKEYVGRRYGKEGSEKAEKNQEVMINKIKQAAQAYAFSLAANDPLVLVSTIYNEHMPFAKRFETALNNLIKAINLGASIREWVMEAFFGIGVLKVCTVAGMRQQLAEGEWVDAGMPYAGVISADDFVMDMSAKSWQSRRYAGDRFRMPLEEFMDTEDFPKESRDAVYKSYSAGEHNRSSEEMARDLSGEDPFTDELEDMIDLWDIHFPTENLVITMLGPDVGNKKALRVVEWSGGDQAPYHPLCFDTVLDNPVPLPPVADMIPLHLLINNMMRKMARQAKNQKTVYAYRGESESDAKRQRDANDGEMVRIDTAEGLQPIRMGGADQANMGVMIQAGQFFNEAAGNINAVLGLGPQSETLGQDQMIQKNVSGKISSQQLIVTRAVAQVCKHLGFILWTHPTLEIPGEYGVPGTPFKVEMNWTPDNRVGAYLDFNFDVEPYSMAYQSPSERLEKVNGFVVNILPAILPMMMEQGLIVDAQEIVNINAEFGNSPELRRIIKVGAAPIEPPQPGPVGQQPTKPPATTRTVIRKNQSTRTQAGTDQENVAKLMASAAADNNPGGA